MGTAGLQDKRGTTRTHLLPACCAPLPAMRGVTRLDPRYRSGPRFDTTCRGYDFDMSESREAAAGQIEPESQPERPDYRGIETTTGEPNTFEPEEDPVAASTLADKTLELFG
jgi:hypothetical protein